jgi:hypothetical protein
MTSRTDALRVCADLRPRLAEIRQEAKLACIVNPLAWIAVHGVSLSEYLAQVDKLDRLCAQAEAELAKGQA